MNIASLARKLARRGRRALAGISLTSCTAKDRRQRSGSGGERARADHVDASDTECELSGAEAGTGPNTFVITNNGTKVTEFYVYGEGERVMGEVENVSPGLERKLIVQLAEPGTYQTACKPGMVGDGLRADFTVTGDDRADRQRGQVQGSRRRATSGTSTARPRR